MKNGFPMMAAMVAVALATPPAHAATSDKKIALSNNYAGNSWRQAMLRSWDKVTKQAVSEGHVAAADSFTTADKEVPSQAAQLQNLILQGYNAIVIDAASPTALNGAVKAACDAGITVVSFDGTVDEPCAYRVGIDYVGMGRAQVDYLAKRLPNGGNLLEIRGLAGASIDDLIHQGIEAGVKQHPNFKIVSSVTGNWDEATAQKAVATVLSSLPEIVGVVDQGGDGYGAAQAFKSAGRAEPIIIMGNRQDELAWWKQQKTASNYSTISASIAPGGVTLAFWVAQQILDGKKVPHDIVFPTLSVTDANLDAALAAAPVGGVYNTEYSQADAVKAISASVAK
ncbi:ABC transporter substrate-binding protein [Lichenicola cladoniae]|uniref:ABC transporter substrate-binding protein n=1 Tax=Lichenicola cladoniae TaxID=1484109 RepID=A0A6M8HLW4_9PROT|nr:ABC transporter substrate-binding protein [Lichenicola cladoniae]NPD69953.1 ABC transporter substrate-binding protein [Acetobacteraceae bacterium]QKE89373.1 ABC transporter substrate-binding protein [Lichenicola cladoniae]